VDTVDTADTAVTEVSTIITMATQAGEGGATVTMVDRPSYFSEEEVVAALARLYLFRFCYSVLSLYSLLALFC
jgi:hypothetical protein